MSTLKKQIEDCQNKLANLLEISKLGENIDLSICNHTDEWKIFDLNFKQTINSKLNLQVECGNPSYVYINYNIYNVKNNFIVNKFDSNECLFSCYINHINMIMSIDLELSTTILRNLLNRKSFKNQIILTLRSIIKDNNYILKLGDNKSNILLAKNLTNEINKLNIIT